jgi:tetratricopeptide (TPR) repeat protein
MHRPAEALAALEETEQSPDSVLLRARILARVGEWEAALQLMIDVGDDLDFPPGAFIRLSLDQLEGSGRHSEALSLLASPEAGRLGERGLLLRAIRLLKELGRVEDARARISEAIRAVSEARSEALLTEHRSAHHSIRREAEAELIGLLLLLQWVEDGLDPRASRAALDEVLRLQPGNAHALNALAYEEVRAGRNLDQAEVWIHEALAQRPFSGAFVDTLAWLRFRQGALDEAQDLIERALRYAPRNPELLEHQAQIEQALAQRSLELP